MSNSDPSSADLRSAVESVLERFEEAWQHEPPPEVADFLPAGPSRAIALAELVHIDLEYRLKRGDPARIEAYLERYPELASNSAVILGLISAEYALRQRREPNLRLDEFERRFPPYAAELRGQSAGGDAPAGLSSSPARVEPGPHRAPRVIFTVTAGPHQGKEFCYEGHDTFIVGRSKQAHFRLPQKDEYFSRVHFLVEVNPPHCRLVDMGSTNGTFVNGQRVGVADLHDGDLIQGGQTVLRVSLEPASLMAVPPRPLPLVGKEFSVGVAAFLQAPAEQTIALPARRTGACPACGAPVLARTMSELCDDCEVLAQRLPQTIPGYRLVRELGKGGMGIVYLALRQSDQAVVALKTIRPTGDASREDVERFLREADILRRLDHPHIVGFREMGEANGRLFFAMDYVRGTDAAALVKKEGPLPVARAVSLVCQMLDGLGYAHALGFVHRDVKPANLLVAEDNGRDIGKLADFGLAAC